MTARERILGMLKGEKIDRIPWCGDLAYWIDYLNDEKIMPEKYLRDQSLEEREDFDNSGRTVIIMTTTTKATAIPIIHFGV